MKLDKDTLVDEVDGHEERMKGPLWSKDGGEMGPMSEQGRNRKPSNRRQAMKVSTDLIEDAIDQMARSLRKAPPAGLTTRQVSGALVRLRPTIRDLLAAAVVNAQHSQSASCACGAKPAPKRELALDYTPRAFPGARAPDGPAPELEDRLVKMGLAEPSEKPIDSAGTQDDEREEAKFAADVEEAWGLANYIDGSEARARYVLTDLGSDDPDDDASWMANIGEAALEQELLKLIRRRRATPR